MVEQAAASEADKRVHAHQPRQAVAEVVTPATAAAVGDPKPLKAVDTEAVGTKNTAVND